MKDDGALTIKRTEDQEVTTHVRNDAKGIYRVTSSSGQSLEWALHRVGNLAGQIREMNRTGVSGEAIRQKYIYGANAELLRIVRTDK